MTDESLNALRPIRMFEVGEWDCAIFQQVSGALAWQALRMNVDDPKREGILPVGFSVKDAEDFVRCAASNFFKDQPRD